MESCTSTSSSSSPSVSEHKRVECGRLADDDVTVWRVLRQLGEAVRRQEEQLLEAAGDDASLVPARRRRRHRVVAQRRAVRLVERRAERGVHLLRSSAPRRLRSARAHKHTHTDGT
eukprot:6187651-Pleurochrysis_carterae.AAC.1